MDAPSFNGRTHQFGQSYGTSPDTGEDDGTWAGAGFTESAEPEPDPGQVSAAAT